MRVALVLALGAGLAGCLGDGGSASDADGHYVYFTWNRMESECLNGVCTYGSNSVPFSEELACSVRPTLSWDASGWKYGFVTGIVKDRDGAEVARHVVSTDGKGSLEVPQGEGPWIFQGSTSNANGNMQMRLTCQEPAA